MTAKEYLQELRSLRNDLRITKTMADNCHIDYNPMRGMDYSASKVQSSPKNSMEEAAWRMLEDREKYMKKVQSLCEEINERLLMIRFMSKPIYTEILYKHYWEYKGLKEIAKESGYEPGTVSNMHNEALAELNAKLVKK